MSSGLLVTALRSSLIVLNFGKILFMASVDVGESSGCIEGLVWLCEGCCWLRDVSAKEDETVLRESYSSASEGQQYEFRERFGNALVLMPWMWTR